MTTQTKPSSGAIRAAEKIHVLMFDLLRRDKGTLTEVLNKSARIVDEESGLAELLEACKGLLEHHGSVDASKAYRARANAQAAIAKATNPNATVQQAYPAGRWTEKKGTV